MVTGTRLSEGVGPSEGRVGGGRDLILIPSRMVWISEQYKQLTGTRQGWSGADAGIERE